MRWMRPPGQGVALCMIAALLAVVGGPAAAQTAAAEHSGVVSQKALDALGLEFYWVAKAAPGDQETPVPPADHKLLRFGREVYVVPREPDFPASAVAELRWEPREQHLTRAGELRDGPYLSFEMKDRKGFARATGANIGRKLLLVSHGEVLMAPVVKGAIPGSGIITDLSAIPPARLQVLLTDLEGAPGTRGLATRAADGTYSVAPVTGTARLTVTARFGDAPAPPLNVELFQLSPTGSPAYPPLLPTVLEQPTGFTGVNLSPGVWQYTLRGDTCSAVQGEVEVRAGEERAVEVTLKHGAAVSGRVVRADTGAPVAGAGVRGGNFAAETFPYDWEQTVTDATGSYRLSRLAPGAVLQVEAEGLVPQTVALPELPERGSVDAPEVLLQRGGRVSGTLRLPAELAPGERWQGIVEPLAAPTLSHPLLYAAPAEGDLTFRLGPLPPGRYRLRATFGRLGTGEPYWRGESQPVEVALDRETGGVVIPLTRREQGQLPPY